jgi:hypothetical protein
MAMAADSTDPARWSSFMASQCALHRGVRGRSGAEGDEVRELGAVAPPGGPVDARAVQPIEPGISATPIGSIGI